MLKDCGPPFGGGAAGQDAAWQDDAGRPPSREQFPEPPCEGDGQVCVSGGAQAGKVALAEDVLDGLGALDFFLVFGDQVRAFFPVARDGGVLVFLRSSSAGRGTAAPTTGAPRP